MWIKLIKSNLSEKVINRIKQNTRYFNFNDYNSWRDLEDLYLSDLTKEERSEYNSDIDFEKITGFSKEDYDKKIEEQFEENKNNLEYVYYDVEALKNILNKIKHPEIKHRVKKIIFDFDNEGL